MKTFNFFLVLAGLVGTSVVTLLKEPAIAWIACPLGLTLSLLSVLFLHMDRRNKLLIRNGEEAIKFLDSMIPDLPEGEEPHVLQIFAKDDYRTKSQSRSIFQRGHFSYSQVIKWVYGLFAILGLLFAAVPFLNCCIVK